MTDNWRAYAEFIPERIHTKSKAETYTVEPTFRSKISYIHNFPAIDFQFNMNYWLSCRSSKQIDGEVMDQKTIASNFTNFWLNSLLFK
jgi:hypothetical protein